MRAPLIVMAMLLAAALVPQHAAASVQEDMICWDPDIEFPVACDGD